MPKGTTAVWEIKFNQILKNVVINKGWENWNQIMYVLLLGNLGSLNLNSQHDRFFFVILVYEFVSCVIFIYFATIAS